MHHKVVGVEHVGDWVTGVGWRCEEPPVELQTGRTEL